MTEQVKILTPEEMEAERLRKKAIADRFGGKIHFGGRKKCPATIIREMMDNAENDKLTVEWREKYSQIRTSCNG